MKYKCLALFLFFVLVVVGQNTAIQSALRNYDYEKALSLLAKERHTPESDFQSARCLRNLNRFEEAITLLEPLSKSGDNNLSVVVELAQCYESLGNLQKASFFYRMGLDWSASNRFLQLKYLNVKYQLREWNETVRMANSILATDTVPGVLSLMADCYQQINKPDSASLLYGLSIRKFPSDYVTILKYAKLCSAANKTDRLLEITGNYLKIDSANVGVNLYNGIGCFMKKLYPQALFRLEKARGLGDNSFLINYYLGAANLAQEEYGYAYEYLFRAFQQDSSNINLHYYLSKAGIYSGNSHKVLGILNRAVAQLIPGDSVLFNYHYLLSEGYARMYNYQMQINELRVCYKYKPEYKFALYTIASLYDGRLKKPEEALEYYRLFALQQPKQITTDGVQGVSYYTAAENRAREIQEDLKKKVR